MLKKVLLAGAASALMMGAAQAADVGEPPPAVYDWTGGYIGIQGGYAWGKSEAETDIDPDFTDIEGLEIDDFNADGFVGGGHAGFLMQSDSFVYGLEGDIEFADMKDDVDIGLDIAGPPLADGGKAEKEIDWLGSLRLRAGVAFDRALVYATGGLAVGGVSLETDLSPLALGVVSNDSDDKTAWGWTIGGGLEYALSDALSARVEYRYTDLGKTDVRVEDVDGDGVDGETDNDFHAVRLGVSWRFGQ